VKRKSFFQSLLKADQPGILACQDSLYVGRLESAGHIYQHTFVDAYSRFLISGISVGRSQDKSLAFLRDIVLPVYRVAGVTLREIATDSGSEFSKDPLRGSQYQVFLGAQRICHIELSDSRPFHGMLTGPIHRLMVDDFYRPFLKESGPLTLEKLRSALNEWVRSYNRRGARDRHLTPRGAPMQLFA
jgi:hypothetical protein